MLAYNTTVKYSNTDVSSTHITRHAECHRELCKSKVLQIQALDETYDIIWQSYMPVKFAKRVYV